MIEKLQFMTIMLVNDMKAKRDEEGATARTASRIAEAAGRIGPSHRVQFHAQGEASASGDRR